MWSGHCPFVYSVSSFLDRKMEMKINTNSKMVGGFPGGSVVKKPPASAGDSVQSLGGKILWRSKWKPTPVFLPGKSHGQKSLEAYSQWGHKESDTT